ncbi:oxygen-independent coproporphyrinogen III oxidase, partial [Candidatus Sumerlaeota bacterium]|nr:oxygen-independent coproporphyrinogen III oxidase [Candidatus Sumerlaeota bacterium]
MAHINSTGLMRDLDREFLKRYDLAGPRYTSYPTAPEWNESVGHAEFAAHLDRVKSDWRGRPLSIYLHIPFCEKHCTFCACNVIISTKMREVSDPYLAYLDREAELFARHNDPARPVIQFHWGGGTPTYLDSEQIRRTHAMITSRFNLAPGAEQSIEIHPPITTDEQLETLASLGFNRLSMGVQDFNERTQEAINRPQTYERTKAITDIARGLGFVGINYDLVYGLPFQSEKTFGETLDKVLVARPDRLALYNFAYLPERLAHQRTLDPATLPDAETKLRIFLGAHDRFREAGYRYIGMDHFALPEDELARAFGDGSLHRNFMGFTT